MKRAIRWKVGNRELISRPGLRRPSWQRAGCAWSGLTEPVGMSKLDGMDRKTLLSMWEQEEETISRILRELNGRNEEEQRFYLHHGGWPAKASSSSE